MNFGEISKNTFFYRTPLISDDCLLQEPNSSFHKTLTKVNLSFCWIIARNLSVNDRFGKFVLQIHAKFYLSTIKYVVFHVTRWFGKLVLTYSVSSLLATLPSEKLSRRYRNRDIYCQFLHYLFFCKFNWQFFLSGFSFTKIHDSQDSRGRGRLFL